MYAKHRQVARGFEDCANLRARDHARAPLKDVVVGKSTTVVDEPLGELVNGTVAINVHESAGNLKTYVACGNLTK